MRTKELSDYEYVPSHGYVMSLEKRLNNDIKKEGLIINPKHFIPEDDIQSPFMTFKHMYITLKYNIKERTFHMEDRYGKNRVPHYDINLWNNIQ
jgi:hypothetical protein